MNNLVAKYARKYNKAVTMRDRKKDYTRKGKSKFQNTERCAKAHIKLARED